MNKIKCCKVFLHNWNIFHNNFQDIRKDIEERNKNSIANSISLSNYMKLLRKKLPISIRI